MGRELAAQWSLNSRRWWAVLEPAFFSFNAIPFP